MPEIKRPEPFGRFLRQAYELLSLPVALLYLCYSQRVNPHYKMGYLKRMALGFRFWRNHRRIETGTSWRAHIVMAMHLLELPPETPGDVVECGCWKGGATANLSLVCAITGRTLLVYDSFEGMPPPTSGDWVAQGAFSQGFQPGQLQGTLQEVKENVSRYGQVKSCRFIKGWFSDSLPAHNSDIAMLFLDVDFCASLHDCLQHLWPRLRKGGYLFLDEYILLPYCAVFFSEKYWSKYFNEAPPGLLGVGTGIQVGMYFTQLNALFQPGHAQASPASIAYSVKGTRALWDYYPDETSQAMTDTAQAVR